MDACLAVTAFNDWVIPDVWIVFILLSAVVYLFYTRREGLFMASQPRGKFLSEFLSDGLIDLIDKGVREEVITPEERTRLFKRAGHLVVDRELLPQEKAIKKKLGDVPLLGILMKPPF